MMSQSERNVSLLGMLETGKIDMPLQWSEKQMSKK